MTNVRLQVFCVIVALLLISLASFIPIHPGAASSADFASTNTAIDSAFTAVQSAGGSGGNISGLVTRLNLAVGLLQRAEGENASNPIQATSDLQNATQIALNVSSSAATAGRAGSQAREVQYGESIGFTVVIVGLAILVYAYGGKIYHQLWLRTYGSYLVRPSGEEKE